jgi:hypothetical protein
MSVEPATVNVDEDRSVEALPDRQVDGPGHSWCERHGGDLAALAQHGQRPMTTFQAEGFDVGADPFGHAQTVQRQQRLQPMGPRRYDRSNRRTTRPCRSASS